MSDTGTGILAGTEPSEFEKRRQESEQQQQTLEAGQKTYTQAELDAMLGKAREQEKNKLHGRIEKLEGSLSEFGTVKEQLAQIEAEREAARKAAEEAEAARVAAEQAAEEEKLGAKAFAMRTREEFEQRFKDMEQQRELERATFEKEREFHALQEYRNQKLNLPEIAAAIPPQLRQFVSGNTPEEVDASIEQVMSASTEMFTEVQQAFAAQRQMMPGVSMRAPSSGPIDPSTQPRTVTAEDVKAMSYEQWAKARTSLLPQANPYR